MSDPFLAFIVAVFVIGVVVLVGFTRRATIVPVTMSARLDRVVEEVNAQKQGLAKAQHDVSNMRQVINHLPTNQSINELKLAMVQSSGEIAGMQSTLARNSKSLDRIEDFLMHAGSEAIANGREAKVKDQT